MKDERMNGANAISLHSIRKIVEKHCPYHISVEAIIALRDMVEEIASNIAIDAVRKFEELNENREKQGLRRLKRFSPWAIKNSDYNKTIINILKNKNMGLQSQGVATPGGENMPAGINTAKPDNKATNDRREVG